MKPGRCGWIGLALVAVAAAAEEQASREQDLAAARALFEANLGAIRNHDKDAYLGTYLNSEDLARTGPEGFTLGYKGLAESAGTGWPDTFEAQDLRFVWVRPGLVYGTYRYRVRFGIEEQTGLSERLFLHTAEGPWRIAVTTAFGAEADTPPPARALVGGTLIDGTGAAPVPDAVVLMRGGKIECAGPRSACAVPADVTVTDMKGRWIVPGLVDAHVHFSQTGWADGRPDALDERKDYPYEAVEAGLAAHPERFFRSYLCSGVTSVFDVGGYAWTLGLPERAERDGRAPRVVAAGPLLSTLDFWLNLPAERQFIFLADAETARAGVRYLAARGSSAVKVWYIVPTGHTAEEWAQSVLAAGEEAKSHKLPLIVHATGLAEAKAALRAGARVLVHSVWDKPVDDEFIDLAKKAGTIYCPTLTVPRGYLRMFEAVVAHKAPDVDDPGGCVDPETLAKVASTAKVEAGTLTADSVAQRRQRSETQEKTGAENLKRVFDAGIPVAMGTDAGNPLTLHGPAVYAEMEAMQKSGLTPMQVLVASTRGGSLAMGREQELGTVQAKKAADLLILGADPTADIANVRQVRAVVRGGVLRSIEELQAVVKLQGQKP
jgi:imidazolonepropionase-like amidohydrolase